MVFCYRNLNRLRQGTNIAKCVLLTTNHLAGLDAISTERASVDTPTAKGDLVQEEAPIRKF